MLYEDGRITVGNITAYLLYMIQLILNFLTLGFVFTNLFKLVGASEQVIKIMKQLPKINPRGGVTIPENEVRGEVELKNVSFWYPTKTDV